MQSELFSVSGPQGDTIDRVELGTKKVGVKQRLEEQNGKIFLI